MSSLWAPIAPGRFRLLRRGEEHNAYVLTTHDITFAPPYRALSYACGTGSRSMSIHCVDRDRAVSETIQITRTLYDALAQLSSRERPLWVDAICIHQKDPVEKARQVAMMHQIYRKADEVAIWLAHDTRRDFIMEDSKALAMDVLNWISMPPPIGRIDDQLARFPALKKRLESDDGTERLTRRQLAELSSVISKRSRVRLIREEFERIDLPAFSDPIWRALGTVLSMPWLFRLWTFQEVMLGRSCIVACGDKTLAWWAYFDVAIGLSQSGLLKHCLSLHEMPRQPRALTVFDRLRPFMDPSQTAVPFSVYLKEARHRDVTETVDRIFAIHSLANETLRTQIKIDYSPRKMQNFWEVFMEVGRAVIETEGAQAILAQASTPQKPPQLPSWCPDFRVPCPVTPFSPGARAGLGHPRQYQAHHDPRLIKVVGAKVDRIDRTSSWFSWAWPDQDAKEIYGENGIAAQTLRWLESCKRVAQKSRLPDEAGAHRAYLLLLFAGVLEGEPTPTTEGSSTSPPLELLSSLAREFVNLTAFDFDSYRTFILDHPDVLNEDPESFRPTAVSANLAGRHGLARRCIERAVFLLLCTGADDQPQNALRYIDNLSNLSEAQEEFKGLFNRLWQQLIQGKLAERRLSIERTNSGIDRNQPHNPIKKDPNSVEALRNEEWLRQKNEALSKFISQLEALQRAECPDDTLHGSERWQELQPILTELGDIWRSRSFFSTDYVDGKFRIGFASDNIRPHDVICVLFGEPHLYILRERKGGLYEFVSDAYVDGLIAGEGCEKLERQLFLIS